MIPIVTAHFSAGFQPATEYRSFRFTKNRAAIVIQQLYASYASRLAIWHAGYGAVDGRGDTAGTTMISTLHGW